jgi:hypothetical protein
VLQTLDPIFIKGIYLIGLGRPIIEIPPFVFISTLVHHAWPMARSDVGEIEMTQGLPESVSSAQKDKVILWKTRSQQAILSFREFFDDTILLIDRKLRSEFGVNQEELS